MNQYDRARSAINQIELQQQEIQRRFQEEQQKLADMLQKKQAELDQKQQQVMARLEREQQKIQDRLNVTMGEEISGRDRILDKATELFAQRGYLDVSMREIAEAAGLRKATIYHHFADKDELFIAVALRAMRERRLEMEELGAQALPLVEQLEAMAALHMNQWNPGTMRLAMDMREHIPESKHDDIHAELFALMDVYRSVFERAIDRGEIAGMNATMAASAFFHLVNAWLWDPFGQLEGHLLEDTSELAKATVRTLLYGIAGPALEDQRHPR